MLPLSMPGWVAITAALPAQGPIAPHVEGTDCGLLSVGARS